MKKLLLLTLTVICLQAKAQFINLPDSNLRNALMSMYPTIFNVTKQMDTILAGNLNFNSDGLQLGYRSIKNFEGLHYFKRAKLVNIGGNFVDSNSNIRVNDSCEVFIMNGNKFNTNAVQLKKIPQQISNHQRIKNLNLNSNFISEILQLPPNLEYLECTDNELVNITNLPQKLKSLNLEKNKLTSLPNFPDSLVELNLKSNLITSLTSFPTILKNLNCSENLLTTLPILPKGLNVIDCSNNKLSTLNYSTNDTNLNVIICENNLITSLPAFPKNLYVLKAYNNRIINLPSIPNNFNFGLDCSFNPLQAIDTTTWPSYFGYLNLTKTKITHLPKKNFRVDNFFIGNTHIIQMPDSISVLDNFLIDSSIVEQIPIFKQRPTKFGLVFCQINNFKFLEQLFDIPNLDFRYSNISSLPSLSTRVTSLRISGTKNLFCLPLISSNSFFTLDIDSSRIGCYQSNALYPTVNNTSEAKPEDLVSVFYSGPLGIGTNYRNYYFKSSSKISQQFKNYPNCNPINNPNRCNPYPKIQGNIYKDLNNDSIKQINEPFVQNILVELKPSTKSFTDANGEFLLNTDTLGHQTLKITPPRFYRAFPNNINLNLNTNWDTTINLPPIALQKTISKDSLAVKITPIMWAARPGFGYPFLVQYENVGSNTVTANINLTYNTTALTYDSSSTTVTPTVGNLQLMRNSFTPGSQGAFVSYFKVKPSAALLGTNLKTWASISGGSALATDTTRRIIGGSYDPNDKLATPQLTTTQVAEGQFINYTIRFQNTGTDTAFTVVIADTLNSLLQANTFEMLGSSHTCKTIIQDNKIYVEFRNILLPDSTTNLIGSNGFVNFRIKPISSVALNTSIPNKAAIYFDYNEPIITNTASTLISNTILPLQLVRFNVLFKQGSGVLFNWETKNEQAVKEFVVEESKDAINFRALQQTTSKGNGDNNYFSNANYAATEMIGSKYYRLKTISNNGSIGYSQIVKLNFDKSILPFIILQNPVKGSLQIQVNAQSLNNTEALLINQEGKVVQGFKLQLGSQTIALTSLGAGVYTLKTKEGSSLVVVAY